MNDVTKGALIESRIDRDVTETTGVGMEFGGLRVQNMLEVMEVSKLMAVSQQAVPAHLRNNPGMCLAVCLTALEWKMSPFSVANKTYVTNDRLNYESQLVHAVIEARAPIKERLRVRYEGEELERVCIVSGTFKGETEPREHRSPPLKECIPPKNEYGKVKGSPLWTKKPDVQMFYDTSRDWIRIYAPDVLLGIYTPDEVEQYGIGDTSTDITPDPGKSLHERLKASLAGSEGFRDGVVEAGLAEKAASEPEASPPAQTQAKPEKRPRASRKKPDAPQAPGGDTPAPPQSSQTALPEGGQEPIPATVDEAIEERMVKAGESPSAGGATQDPKEPAEQPAGPPTSAKEYIAYCETWITAATNADDADARYDGERDMRDELNVPIPERNRMVDLIREKFSAR